MSLEELPRGGPEYLEGFKRHFPKSEDRRTLAVALASHTEPEIEYFSHYLLAAHWGDDDGALEEVRGFGKQINAATIRYAGEPVLVAPQGTFEAIERRGPLPQNVVFQYGRVASKYSLFFNGAADATSITDGLEPPYLTFRVGVGTLTPVQRIAVTKKGEGGVATIRPERWAIPVYMGAVSLEEPYKKNARRQDSRWGYQECSVVLEALARKLRDPKSVVRHSLMDLSKIPDSYRSASA